MKKQKAANDNHKTALSFEEAVEVWLRYWAGQYQHDIAAHFGVNSGRVSEVLKEKKHVGSREAAEKLRKKSA
jgi:DNA-binding transcriptional regulator LsrR (DeoR family)